MDQLDPVRTMVVVRLLSPLPLKNFGTLLCYSSGQITYLEPLVKKNELRRSLAVN